MKGGIERIRLDEIVEAECAWIGCQETYSIPKGSDPVTSLPEGWRLLVVANGSLLDPENLLNADVDGSICPRHHFELLTLLKAGRLKGE